MGGGASAPSRARGQLGAIVRRTSTCRLTHRPPHRPPHRLTSPPPCRRLPGGADGLGHAGGAAAAGLHRPGRATHPLHVRRRHAPLPCRRHAPRRPPPPPSPSPSSALHSHLPLTLPRHRHRHRHRRTGRASPCRCGRSDSRSDALHAFDTQIEHICRSVESIAGAITKKQLPQLATSS